VTYIFDACRVAEGSQPVVQSNISANQLYEGLLSPLEFIFYSTEKEYYSYETNKLEGGNGLFTFFLTLGLKGAADRKPFYYRISAEELRDLVN